MNSRRFRKKGFLKFLVGSVGAAAVAYIYILAYHHDINVPSALVIVFALPGAVACMGVIEMVTGDSFMLMSKRWADLKGWQRGILGTSVFFVGLLLIFVAMWLMAKLNLV